MMGIYIALVYSLPDAQLGTLACYLNPACEQCAFASSHHMLCSKPYFPGAKCHQHCYKHSSHSTRDDPSKALCICEVIRSKESFLASAFAACDPRPVFYYKLDRGCKWRDYLRYLNEVGFDAVKCLKQPVPTQSEFNQSLFEDISLDEIARKLPTIDQSSKLIRILRLCNKSVRYIKLWWIGFFSLRYKKSKLTSFQKTVEFYRATERFETDSLDKLQGACIQWIDDSSGELAVYKSTCPISLDLLTVISILDPKNTDREEVTWIDLHLDIDYEDWYFQALVATYVLKCIKNGLNCSHTEKDVRNTFCYKCSFQLPQWFKDLCQNELRKCIQDPLYALRMCVLGYAGGQIEPYWSPNVENINIWKDSKVLFHRIFQDIPGSSSMQQLTDAYLTSIADILSCRCFRCWAPSTAKACPHILQTGRRSRKVCPYAPCSFSNVFCSNALKYQVCSKHGWYTCSDHPTPLIPPHVRDQITFYQEFDQPPRYIIMNTIIQCLMLMFMFSRKKRRLLE